jgi:hypothetical protein
LRHWQWRTPKVFIFGNQNLSGVIEAVVPVDMVLAFGREQSARARRGERRRSHQEDVKEKLKLWAKAVAAKARQDVIKHNSKKNACVHGV